MQKGERPHAIIVGSPPAFRGTVKQGRDVELQILKAFPIKTPAVSLSSWCSEEEGAEGSWVGADPCSRRRSSSRSPSVPTRPRTLSPSVARCTTARPSFRSATSSATSRVRPVSFARARAHAEKADPLRSGAEDALHHRGQRPARHGDRRSLRLLVRPLLFPSSCYAHPLARRYAKIDKPAWWMKSRDCGPIIEQATHFVDLSRYFGGDVDLSSVQAHALGEFLPDRLLWWAY